MMHPTSQWNKSVNLYLHKHLCSLVTLSVSFLVLATTPIEVLGSLALLPAPATRLGLDVMPIRRPSASAGHVFSTNSVTKVHRSNDSHHVFPGPSQLASIAYSAAPATPQQKIVQALINRIKNKVLWLLVETFIRPQWLIIISLAPLQFWSFFGRGWIRSCDAEGSWSTCRPSTWFFGHHLIVTQRVVGATGDGELCHVEPFDFSPWHPYMRLFSKPMGAVI